MPKPIAERQTANPLGQKINVVMREKGIEGDYARLAQIFGVKTPSVYDWVTHGRLGKERFPTLVQWSGRSLDWWFDIPSAPSSYSTDTPTTAHKAQEPAASVQWLSQAVKSPFPRISASEWAALPPQMVREIETYALGLIAGLRMADPDMKRQNGA